MPLSCSDIKSGVFNTLSSRCSSTSQQNLQPCCSSGRLFIYDPHFVTFKLIFLQSSTLTSSYLYIIYIVSYLEEFTAVILHYNTSHYFCATHLPITTSRTIAIFKLGNFSIMCTLKYFKTFEMGECLLVV